ncbi:MAG: hypothetical protein HW416_854 [Chloroflexi bacterium]|nr:hypothetical protein [Chloroflexota bacterium]
MILPTIFDTPNRFTLSGVDLSNVPATPEQLATAARALSEDSLLVAGTIQRQPNAGPAGDGRVLVATQFYLPATPADGQR